MLCVCCIILETCNVLSAHGLSLEFDCQYSREGKKLIDIHKPSPIVAILLCPAHSAIHPGKICWSCYCRLNSVKREIHPHNYFQKKIIVFKQSVIEHHLSNVNKGHPTLAKKSRTPKARGDTFGSWLRVMFNSL